MNIFHLIFFLFVLECLKVPSAVVCALIFSSFRRRAIYVVYSTRVEETTSWMEKEVTVVPAAAAAEKYRNWIVCWFDSRNIETEQDGTVEKAIIVFVEPFYRCRYALHSHAPRRTDIEFFPAVPSDVLLKSLSPSWRDGRWLRGGDRDFEEEWHIQETPQFPAGNISKHFNSISLPWSGAKVKREKNWINRLM